MSLDQHLLLLRAKIQECHQEVKKAETFEARIFSYRTEACFNKDLLEENLNVLKEDGVIASLDEYKAVKSSYLIASNTIRTYDIDLERLRSAINTYKARIVEMENEILRLNKESEMKKNNVVAFARKKK